VLLEHIESENTKCGWLGYVNPSEKGTEGTLETWKSQKKLNNRIQDWFFTDAVKG
jgi:hypothetical protein